MAEGRATPISGCVISYQEADRIADCVRSLSFCDEVIVVDSGSTDGTDRIAAELGARVVTNTPFPGHVEQKRIAVQQARHDLVFCLDADERATPELQARVRDLRDAGAVPVACEMPRRNWYLGKVMRRGLFWPDRKIRLFDRRHAQWGGVNPHDRVELQAGIEVVRIEAAIEHLSYRDFGHHRRTIDAFTRIAAQAMATAGRRAGVFDLLLRPPAVFFKSLVLKRGFLDGWRGGVVAAMAAYTDWKKYWRLWRTPRPRGPQ